MRIITIIMLALALIGCTSQPAIPYYGGGSYGGDDFHMIMYPDLSQQPGFFYGDGEGGGTFYPHGISEPPIQIY